MARGSLWYVRELAELRASPEAKRLREAALAWAAGNEEANRNGGSHPKGEGFFAMKIDAELLDAAIAFAVKRWTVLRPHEDVVYGLRLLWKMAIPRDPWISLPPARGRARTRQQASIAAVEAWLKSLPDRVVPRVEP